MQTTAWGDCCQSAAALLLSIFATRMVRSLSHTHFLWRPLSALARSLLFLSFRSFSLPLPLPFPSPLPLPIIRPLLSCLRHRLVACSLFISFLRSYSLRICERFYVHNFLDICGIVNSVTMFDSFALTGPFCMCGCRKLVSELFNCWEGMNFKCLLTQRSESNIICSIMR